MVVVQVHPTRAPPIGEQRVLFSATPYSADPLHQMYDVSPDGRRFLMTRIGGAAERVEVKFVVVQNFFEELRATVKR